MANDPVYGKVPFPTVGPGLFSGSFLGLLFQRIFQGGIASEGGITATAGGTKAAARVLTKSINVISVCATNGDSALLPKAIIGSVVFVVNGGAASLQVFGKGTDTINGIATATGVAQATGISATYVCAVAGAWFRVLSA